MFVQNPTSSSEKKSTLGKQWVDVHTKYAGQKTQTVRETTDEMGKEYMKSLWKLVEMHKGYPDDYYIMEIVQPEALLEGVIKMKHIARKSRPLPEWGLALYKVHSKSGTVTYEWGLPRKEEAYIMIQNPEGWHSKIISDIRDYVQGSLT